MPEHRTPGRWHALLVALCLTSAIGHAQPANEAPADAPAPTAKDQAKPEAPAAEPGGDAAVPDEPERLTDRMSALHGAKKELDGLLVGARKDTGVARLLEQWDGLVDPSQELAENLDRARARGAASDILHDHLAAAERRRSEIAEWLLTLHAEVARLDELAKRTDELLATWRPRSQGGDPEWAELAPMVASMLARAEELPAELARRQEEVASRLTSIGQVDRRLEEAVTTGRAEYRRQSSSGWLRIEHAAFSDLTAHDLGDMRAHASERWVLNLDVVRAYLLRRPWAYAVQLALWLGSTLLLMRAGRRRRQGVTAVADGALDDVVAQVERHPLAGGFLVSMGASLLLHEDAPTLHHAVLHTLGVFAALWVMRGSRSAPGLLLYVLWLLVIADWVRALALGRAGLGRLVMDAELMMLVGLCTGLITRGAAPLPMYLEYRHWLPTAYRALRAAAVLAVAADLIGLEVVGRTLGRGALRSAYLLTVSLGLYWALLATVSALCEEPFTRAVRSLDARRARVLPGVARVAHRVLPLAWAWIVSDAFGISAPLASAVGWLWNTSLAFGDIHISAGDIVTFGIVVWASLVVSRVLRALLEDDVMARTSLPGGVPYAITTTTHYVVVILGGFLALSAAGVDMTRFTVLAGAFGVGIGFGMQNIVNNFVSGLILLYERPIKVGDTIEVETLQGEVKRIGIRSSTVRMFSGAEVLVPNATLVSTKVINFTLSDRSRRIDFPVGVAYGTDPSAMLELLRKVANSQPRVLPNPAPLALFLGFGASSLDFELRVWVADFADGASARSDLAVALGQALTAAGIEVPFPQTDLHVRSVADAILAKRS